jgi:hypothetical protein
MIAILIAAAAAGYGPSGPVLTPLSSRGEARTVIEQQLRSPPRPGQRGGVSPEEADRIMARYLASIGVSLQPNSSTQSGPQQ